MINVTPYLGATRIAYLSMEIGIRPEIHTYSGGLGILAGDAARSAADLGLPIVFVTLASRSGYLYQEIDSKGAQIDASDPWNPSDYTQAVGVMVAVAIEGRTVWIRAWLYELKSPLGRQVPIILLDTNVAENDPRDITHNLRTIIIDAEGKLVKTYVGNEWTPQQVMQDLQGLGIGP